mmetsp:Transcript_24980/g.68891  ORF Transcript_24980/g.68891 Transcript_24980/m.68891 type:complete len:221 (+) Transcript_24980:1574-2236(+)
MVRGGSRRQELSGHECNVVVGLRTNHLFLGRAGTENGREIPEGFHAPGNGWAVRAVGIAQLGNLVPVLSTGDCRRGREHHPHCLSVHDLTGSHEIRPASLQESGSKQDGQGHCRFNVSKIQGCVSSHCRKDDCHRSQGRNGDNALLDIFGGRERLADKCCRNSRCGHCPCSCSKEPQVELYRFETKGSNTGPLSCINHDNGIFTRPKGVDWIQTQFGSYR